MKFNNKKVALAALAIAALFVVLIWFRFEPKKLFGFAFWWWEEKTLCVDGSSPQWTQIASCEDSNPAAAGICSCSPPSFSPDLGQSEVTYCSGANSELCGGCSCEFIGECSDKGACCFDAMPPDPFCEDDLTEQECTGKGGAFRKGEFCSNINTCKFACCTPEPGESNNHCQLKTKIGCMAGATGSIPAGDIWHLGKNCSETDCTGACCLNPATLSCIGETSQFYCDTAGYKWIAGEDCLWADCAISSAAASVSFSYSSSQFSSSSAPSFNPFDVSSSSAPSCPNTVRNDSFTKVVDVPYVNCIDTHNHFTRTYTGDYPQLLYDAAAQISQMQAHIIKSIPDCSCGVSDYPDAPDSECVLESLGDCVDNGVTCSWKISVHHIINTINIEYSCIRSCTATSTWDWPGDTPEFTALHDAIDNLDSDQPECSNYQAGPCYGFGCYDDSSNPDFTNQLGPNCSLSGYLITFVDDAGNHVDDWQNTVRYNYRITADYTTESTRLCAPTSP